MPNDSGQGVLLAFPSAFRSGSPGDRARRAARPWRLTGSGRTRTFSTFTLAYQAATQRPNVEWTVSKGDYAVIVPSLFDQDEMRG